VLVDGVSGIGLVVGAGRRYLVADWQLKVEGPAEPEPLEKPGKKKSKPGKKRSR
jgi:hypothetical protein